MLLTEKLDKIRSPKLQNQRETAVVLSALEETLKSQSYEFTPTAYFAALCSLLSQSILQNGIVNKELATSVVYLLDLVTAYVPASLLRSKFSQILTGLAPALHNAEAEAPLIKSSIGCLESLLLAQDKEAWALPQTQISPRQAIAGLLVLAQDHRPKVRKRAQEAITRVLQSPLPGPSLDHPAAEMCAETAMRGVKDILATMKVTGKKQHKEKRRSTESHHPGLLHALHLVRTIASASGGWPSRKIEPLCDVLMQLSGSNEWLTMTAFEIFETIFRGLTDEVASAKLPNLIRTIEKAKPAIGDDRLISSWCAVVGRGYEVFAQIEPLETFQKLPDIFEAVKPFCASGSHDVRVSASQCMIKFLANCVPHDVILKPSIYDEKVLEKIVRSSVDMLSVKYQSAWMEVFTVLSALFTAFKWRSAGFLDDVIRIVGELRENEAFTGKKEADEVLGKAVSSMGPANVLKVLPLHLASPKAGQPGRAWLLPILRDNVHNTELAHFTSEMVPLSEKIFQRVIEHGSAEKTMEVKIFETLVQQIWAILPGYCTLALDVTLSFDQAFAELLSNLLYKQTELRADICSGLQTLIESYRTIIASDLSEKDQCLRHRLTKADAQRSLDHLSAFAGNLLAVLFNVYSQTLPHHRGYILQCINAFLSITPGNELLETFDRVAKMLEDALREASRIGPQKHQENKGQPIMPPTSHTLMDLVITLSIYLPRSAFSPLFGLAARILPLHTDSQLQKKAYKLLPRLASSVLGTAALQEQNAELQELMMHTADAVSASARRDRLSAIAVVVKHLPEDDLHFIPSLLSEAVIACKETNEKARTAAFDLLILMAERMSRGGVVRQSKIPHMDASAPTAQASLEEFITMVAAGLVGSSPHMISASVTALTRISYEFVGNLPQPVMEDLVQTMSVFLTSTNREIVRSVLGFVKFTVISLPTSLVQPRLGSLIPGLMSWSHEHKARFRTKVKHILERAVRRFGYDEIERYCPGEDKKLIIHIRKTREKRKKRRATADSDEDTEPTKKDRFESEYDEALYGSDSSASGALDSDIDDAAPRSRNGKPNGAYITETSDEPLDLLDRKTLANISSTKPQARKIPTNMNKAKLDADGKLIIRDNNSDTDDDHGGAMAVDAPDDGIGGIDAYVEAVSGKDAVQRGQRGRLKYNHKRTNKGDEMDLDSNEEVRNDIKKVRFASKNGRQATAGGTHGGANAVKTRPKGGVAKRVQRKPFGGGKVNGGRVGKVGGRR